MPRVIAYYDTETLIVRDLDPYNTGDEIPPKPGMTARIAMDNAVAVGWKWDDAAEGFVPVPEPETPPVNEFEGLGAQEIIAMAQQRLVDFSEKLQNDVGAALQAAASQL